MPEIYVDQRGWRYRVMCGIGGDTFKGRYQKPGKTGWKCMANLPWKNSFEEAQTDLDNYARKKGWKAL